MNQDIEISREELDSFYENVKKDVENHGYHLNSNVEFTKELLMGILTNEKRYGYGACPCRLAVNNKDIDLDIICPCDYRDPDLNDYDTCYCGLYVSGDILEGKKEITAIPERRPPLEKREQNQNEALTKESSSPQLPVWRCSVCGYLCARDDPPEVCPICKVGKERFKRFI